VVALIKGGMADFDCVCGPRFSPKFIPANPAANYLLTETSDIHHAVDKLSAGLSRVPDERTRSDMQQLMQAL
jgi:hypothetical protein